MEISTPPAFFVLRGNGTPRTPEPLDGPLGPLGHRQSVPALRHAPAFASSPTQGSEMVCMLAAELRLLLARAWTVPGAPEEPYDGGRYGSSIRTRGSVERER
jgi:hypothetical protein